MSKRHLCSWCLPHYVCTIHREMDMANENPDTTSNDDTRTSAEVTAAFIAGARAARARIVPDLNAQTYWDENWGPDPGPLDLTARLSGSKAEP